MPAKATTFRIDPRVQAGLENLSRLLKRPMNQLVNEAVKEFVRKRSTEVEHKLESTLAALRAYRERDPDFEWALSSFARAEAQHGKLDPAEGEVVVGDLVDGQLVETPEGGPVRQEIRKLLNG